VGDAMSSTVQIVTKVEFDQLQYEYQAALENPEVAEVFIAMCGSREIAQAFANPKGVGIAAFAKLVNMPVTTVRHYVELGLVSPMQLFGKFKFMVFNVPQIESVRGWRDLGLSLEEILVRRQNLGEGVLLKEVLPNEINLLGESPMQPIVQVMRVHNPEERAQAKQDFAERRKRGEPGIVLERHEQGAKIPGLQTDFKTVQTELQLEYKSIIQKLEARKLELEKRIARAKLIAEKLKNKTKP
jgi:DNA-binding transcriptional MerR regulator